jgi:NAD(P)-dependent dehydrogenase (short-subunit alcohol dehydrogenase family)
MSEKEIAGAAALVTGASRGFGRGIATALCKAGAQVAGVARDRAGLDDLRAELGESFTPVPADAADPVVAGQLIDKYHPGVLVLNAGAGHPVRLGAAAADPRDRPGRGVFRRLRRPAGPGRPGPGGPALTPEQAGQAITGLVTGGGYDQDAYLLTAAGLRPLP